jgi:hypothetical protein
MKRTRPASPKRLPASQPSPEAIDQACITPQHALDMLVGEGDSYYHQRIERVLAQAGLRLWRLERDQVHPVWVGWIRPGKAGLAADKAEASRQIRRILTRAGLKIKSGELTVFDRRKDMIRLTFMFPWGCAGLLVQSPPVGRGSIACVELAPPRSSWHCAGNCDGALTL